MRTMLDGIRIASGEDSIPVVMADAPLIILNQIEISILC